MKIYEFEPNKMYKNPATGISYMIDTSGECGGSPAFVSNEEGLWNYCFLSYSELLAMDFEPVLKTKNELQSIKDIAKDIYEDLKHRGFGSSLDSSGCFAVRTFEDGTERLVDVYKSSCKEPHYVIWRHYEDEDSDFVNTDDLSLESLTAALQEFYDVPPVEKETER